MSDEVPEQGGAFATLTLDGRSPVDVRVAAVGAGTMTVLVLRGAAPAPDDGHQGRVAVEDFDDDGRQTNVHVVQTRGDGAAYVITLRYRDADGPSSMAEVGESEHVAMRASFRVAPGEDENILVEVHRGEEVHAAQLVDVSASGIGLEVLDDAVLDKGDVCGLDLGLPGTGGRFHLDARICFVGELHGHPRYGLEFVVKDTASSQRSVAQVVTYVMRRQREMLTRPNA